MKTALGITLAAVALSGCKRLATGAEEKFSAEYTCPDSRIDVRARPDVLPSSILGPPSPKKPPADVAADPERLALFNQRQSADQEKWKSSVDGYDDAYEARGCGHRALYLCHHAGGSHGGTRMDVVNCYPHDVAADRLEAMPWPPTAANP